MLGGCAGDGWQRKSKTSPFSRLALDNDLAAVSLHHLLHDSQTQSGATGGACARGVRAIETFKEVRQMFGRNANSGILHAYFDQRLDGSGGNADLSLAGSMYNGIAQQVAENLGDPFLVGFDTGQIGGNMYVQRQIFPRDSPTTIASPSQAAGPKDL